MNKTNEELQDQISRRIDAIESGQKDLTSTRVFFNGCKTLLKSVAIDIQSAKEMGKPLYPRTKRFLGVEQ